MFKKATMNTYFFKLLSLLLGYEASLGLSVRQIQIKKIKYKHQEKRIFRYIEVITFIRCNIMTNFFTHLVLYLNNFCTYFSMISLNDDNSNENTTSNTHM